MFGRRSATIARGGLRLYSMGGAAGRSAVLVSKRVASLLGSGPTTIAAVRAVAPVCVGGVSRRAYSTNLPDHEVIAMPALSPTMEMGTIVTWNVAVGDEVNAGDSLADIETDKATMSFG